MGFSFMYYLGLFTQLIYFIDLFHTPVASAVISTHVREICLLGVHSKPPSSPPEGIFLTPLQDLHHKDPTHLFKGMGDGDGMFFLVCQILGTPIVKLQTNLE